MLFYQQDDLEEGMFLPNFNGQTPDSASDDEEYENEVRRLRVRRSMKILGAGDGGRIL